MRGTHPVQARRCATPGAAAAGDCARSRQPWLRVAGVHAGAGRRARLGSGSGAARPRPLRCRAGPLFTRRRGAYSSPENHFRRIRELFALAATPYARSPRCDRVDPRSDAARRPVSAVQTGLCGTLNAPEGAAAAAAAARARAGPRRLGAAPLRRAAPPHAPTPRPLRPLPPQGRDYFVHRAEKALLQRRHGRGQAPRPRRRRRRGRRPMGSSRQPRARPVRGGRGGGAPCGARAAPRVMGTTGGAATPGMPAVRPRRLGVRSRGVDTALLARPPPPCAGVHERRGPGAGV
jgi:hypothetical protein